MLLKLTPEAARCALFGILELKHMDNFLDPRKSSPPLPRPAASGKISYGPASTSSKESKEDDIVEVWDEQKRIRAQDRLLEIEYELAKEKAKRLREQIKQNQIGDETIFGDDLKKYMPGYRAAANSSGLKIAKKAVEQTAAKAQQLRLQAKTKKFNKPATPNNLIPVAAATSQATKPNKRLKPLMLGLGSLVIVAGLGVGGLYQFRSQSESSTKQAVLGTLVANSAAVNDLFFPSDFPVDYPENKVTATRPEDAKDVYIVTLAHANDANKSIFISQQALPKNFNINEFNSTLEKPEVFITDAGQATIGLVGADNLHVVSIVGQQQWILINASSEVELKDLRQVAMGLTK